MKIKFIKIPTDSTINFWLFEEDPSTSKHKVVSVHRVTFFSLLLRDENSVLEELQSELEAKYGEKVELEESKKDLFLEVLKK
jgi:hypothetical protein